MGGGGDVMSDSSPSGCTKIGEISDPLRSQNRHRGAPCMQAGMLRAREAMRKRPHIKLLHVLQSRVAGVQLLPLRRAGCCGFRWEG